MSQRGYLFDHFVNLSKLLFNFKLMSDFNVTNQTKVKSHFIINKISPIINVPLVCFLDELEDINNVYNKTLPLW